jgi:hypothetical protein
MTRLPPTIAGKPYLRPQPGQSWSSLDSNFPDPAQMPYKKNTDNEEENYIIFCTMVCRARGCGTSLQYAAGTMLTMSPSPVQVRVKMDVALQESSMIMNPELSFKERVEVIKYARGRVALMMFMGVDVHGDGANCRQAFDFVLATEEIFADEAPEPSTPEPTRRMDGTQAFNFHTSGTLDDFVSIEKGLPRL